MNLYYVCQEVNNEYDTYNSFVAVCETEDDARHTHPSEHYKWMGSGWGFIYFDGRVSNEGRTTHDWCDPDDVKVDLIGTSYVGIRGVICASFNAG